MKVTWVCKKCGKITDTEAIFNRKTDEYHTTLPEPHVGKYIIGQCIHDWCPVEIRRGI